MKYNVSILEFIFSMFKISWFIFQFFTLIFSEPLNLFRKVKGVRIIDLCTFNALHLLQVSEVYGTSPI